MQLRIAISGFPKVCSFEKSCIDDIILNSILKLDVFSSNLDTLNWKIFFPRPNMVGPQFIYHFDHSDLKCFLLTCLLIKCFVVIESSVISFSTIYLKLLYLIVLNKKITLLNVMFSFKIFQGQPRIFSK